MAVNVYGVLHGIQAFVPRMIEHGEEGLILNTSSVVGLTTGTSSAYGVAKHAVSRMTEGLHYDLRAAGSKLRAALLVPGQPRPIFCTPTATAPRPCWCRAARRSRRP